MSGPARLQKLTIKAGFSIRHRRNPARRTGLARTNPIPVCSCRNR
jgi:hypothetical protein